MEGGRRDALVGNEGEGASRDRDSVLEIAENVAPSAEVVVSGRVRIDCVQLASLPISRCTSEQLTFSRSPRSPHQPSAQACQCPLSSCTLIHQVASEKPRQLASLDEIEALAERQLQPLRQLLPQLLLGTGLTW